MTESNGRKEAERLERAVQAFVEQVRHLPPDLLRREPEPGEWSVAQIAAHSAEIYGYWARQINQLKASPGQPFGRTATDPQRTAYVEDHKDDPIESLIGAIQRGAAEAAAALRAYSDQEWQTVTGLHAARGEMNMDFIANLFLAGHAEEHLKQLAETMEKVSGS